MIVSGAEWGLVPGQHLTEAIQRDLEAVIEASPWSAHRVLALLGIPEARDDRRKKRTVWEHGGGRRPLAVAQVSAILTTARAHTAYGYRQVHAALRWEHPAVQVAPITVYRVLNRHGLLGPRTTQKSPQKQRPWVRFERAKPHELWQVDVSYWYIEGWGYYYLHTVLDDPSRYIITSRLYRTYGADDGIQTLQEALAAVPAAQRAGVQLLADHGVTYIADTFRQACQAAEVELIFASVAHPQTKGKRERWHRTLREALGDRVHYAATPQAAQGIIDEYVAHYNHQRPLSACNGYPRSGAIIAPRRGRYWDYRVPEIAKPYEQEIRTPTANNVLPLSQQKKHYTHACQEIDEQSSPPHVQKRLTWDQRTTRLTWVSIGHFVHHRHLDANHGVSRDPLVANGLKRRVFKKNRNKKPSKSVKSRERMR